jgi:hypothetical protein
MGHRGLPRGRRRRSSIWTPGIALAFAATLAIGACDPSGSTPGPIETSTRSAAPTASSPVTTPEASVSTTPAASAIAGCSLDDESTDWAPLPEDEGRCHVTVFSPPMSFDPTPGWRWAANRDRWAMTRDNGAFTLLTMYRYGGAVVPPYCEDPPDTLPMSAGSDIVAWLETVPGLEVSVVGRSVGASPAWQLDLAAPGVKSCSGDPGKAGLASLWTIDGQPIELPESLSNDETMRVYLIETGTQIVVMTATSNPIEGMPDIPDNTDFLLRVDEIFGSLGFD